MLTSGEIEVVSMSMDKSLNALEMRIMEDIVRRIKINGEITRSADWQITRLLQLGMSMKEIENDIKSALDFSDEKMLEMYSNIVSSGYARDKNLYEAVGAAFIPFEQNHELQQLVSAVASQTNSTLKNITQSLGFAVRQPDGKLQFIKLAEYYQKTLDNAMLDITSGAFDYNTVLKRTVKEMTNSGLRTVSYASGWSNRVDVAARRAVMTGMSQITAKINEDNAEALDTDMFEVTWHSGARPEHQVWQGRWYTRKQLETVCGLGTVTGLCGANCYHDYYPVIPGVSEPAYTEEKLEELNAKENTPVEYNGKQYTKYEALQRQRRLETTMRAQRQEIKLLKDGNASEDDLINARCRYRGTSAEYAKFSQAMGLPQQRERVNIDGLGNIGQGRYTGGSGERSSVQVPPVGAKVVDKVSDQERLELLEKNPVDISGRSGIMKVEDSGNFSDMKNYLLKTYDVDLDNSVESLNFEMCKSVLKGAETVISEYPELGNNLKRITTSNTGVMCCTGKEICFNPTYFLNSNNFSDICKTQSATGFWIKNSSPASIGVHETAHAIEQLLIDLNPNYNYEWEKTLAWNDCSEAKKIVSQAIKEVKKTVYGKGKQKNELINEVSRYASTSASETMAEAFADVYANGDSANPLSILIKDLTHSQYLKYKKGGN